MGITGKEPRQSGSDQPPIKGRCCCCKKDVLNYTQIAGIAGYKTIEICSSCLMWSNTPAAAAARKAFTMAADKKKERIKNFSKGAPV